MNANLDGIPRSGYIFKVCLIVLLLFVDLVINNTADANDLGAGGTTNPIIFIGAQLFIQLINFLMFFMLFFGTYLFQVGLIGLLVKEFRNALWASMGYACVYAAYAACKLYLLINMEQSQGELWASSAFCALSILQKIAAIGYYLLVLRMCVRIGEARWYQRKPWVDRFSQVNSAAIAR